MTTKKTYENAVTRHTVTSHDTRDEADAPAIMRLMERLAAAPPYTFDSLIGGIERAVERRCPPAPESTFPERLSKEWYAEEIRDRIGFVRRLLKGGDAPAAAAAAFELGILHYQACAAFGWGPYLKDGRAIRRGRLSGANSTNQGQRDTSMVLAKRFDEFQQKNPDLRGKVARDKFLRYLKKVNSDESEEFIDSRLGILPPSDEALARRIRRGRRYAQEK